MHKITEFVLKRPVTTFLVVVSLIFFGFMSITNQKMELMSDIEMPMMIVTTTYAGASPEDVDKLITKLTKLVDPQSGLFPVEATLSGADALSDGSSTKLSLVAAKADHALLVPVDAVYYSGGNPYVYTYENGLVKRVFITTGISDDQYYEVTDGLDGTEQIVNSWTDDIYDGAEVRIVDANGQTIEDASTGAETEETHAAD